MKATPCRGNGDRGSRLWMQTILLGGFIQVGAMAAMAQSSPPPAAASAAAPTDTEPLAAALSPQVWTQVENAIDRALSWLATQQNRDGSFDAPDNAQPAATSLSVMAYISKGHRPGEGPYGRRIESGIDYVLSGQRADGLLSAAGSRWGYDGKTALYNHAIAGLMLTEVYGMTDPGRAAKLKPAILRALQYTRKRQTVPKDPEDQGGWRYLYSDSYDDSDLSVTAWQLMFLRSAKNAEFDVPKQHIDEAVAYVLRCAEPSQGVFYYKKSGDQVRWSRGMVGAGILSLSLSGMHETPLAQRAGDWLLTRPFRRFGESVGSGDRFFYSVYYCSQAVAQLGGRHWKQFYPSIVQVLLSSQESSGEWPPEPHSGDRVYGNTCTTAMAVLSLTPPLQLLPVYQR